MPDRYVVRGSDNEMCLSVAEAKTDVIDDNVEIKEDLLISGYSVKGSVEDQGRPLADVRFSLYGKKGTQVTCGVEDVTATGQSTSLKRSEIELTLLCVVRSAADGGFGFKCVPPGEYVVATSYSTPAVAFDVVPSVVSISVGDGALLLKEKFKISGFSVKGEIRWSAEGAGVEGATVFVNSKAATKTDVSGSYLLAQLNSGDYKVHAELEQLQFSSVDVHLSPKMTSIPAILVEKIQLCGQILIEKKPKGTDFLAQRKVILTDEKGRSFSITTDSKGSFCQMVAPGRYTLSPHILPTEADAGLSLIPKSKEIIVKKLPIDHALFRQFEAHIAGQVHCLSPCKKVSVHLFEEGVGGAEIASSVFSAKQQVHSYKLGGVLPGRYRVSVSADNFCWYDGGTAAVVVSESNLDSVNFRQIGFGAAVHSSSDDVALKWEFSGSSVVKGVEKLKKGENSFCLPVAGNYKFQLESCHKFARDGYDYNTDSEQRPVLSLLAERHLVTGSVTVYDLPIEGKHDIQLRIGVTGSEDMDSELVELKSSSKESKAGVAQMLRFSYFGATSSELIATPHSAVFLFEPESVRLSVNEDCHLDEVRFDGQLGLFATGQLLPPVEDVTVEVRSTQGRDDAGLVFFGRTNSSGGFRVGPMRSLRDLSYKFVKEGYVFTPIEGKPASFRAYKLSRLHIEARVRGAVEGELGEPLTGVLVSLTGGSYRTNNLTDDKGQISFVGLSPDEYFIRPVLKEYKFEPATKRVQIKEGAVEELALVGSRVAFSCYGQVRLVGAGGVGESGQMVEALSEACEQLHEQALTDEDGRYRIRGLKPNCAYRLSLSGGPLTFPRKYELTVTTDDVRDKDFLVQPVQNTMEVSGRIVLADRRHLATLKLLIFKESDPENVIYSTGFQQSTLFFVDAIPLDGESYVALLKSSLSASQYVDFKEPRLTFMANETFKLLVFDFAPVVRRVEAEISRSSYFLLPLALLLAFVGYNHATVLPAVREGVNSLRDRLAGVRAASSSEEDETAAGRASPTQARKRPRPKKT